MTFAGRATVSRVAIFGAIFLASSLYGTMRRVPQDYLSIQAAFDVVVDDDTVLVSIGTYAEELSAPPHRFWFIGDVPVDTGDFPRPVIDPSSLDSAQWRRCLAIPDSCTLTIERMAFCNRAPMYPRALYATGGIYVRSEEPVTFRFCRLDSVYWAISDVADSTSPLRHPRIVVEDCRFVNAPSVQIRAVDTRYLLVRRSSFQNKRGSFILGGDSSHVEECSFSGDSLGSGVSLNGQNPIIHDCVFGPIDTCWIRILMFQGARDGLVEGNLFHDIRVISPEFFAIFVVDSTPIRFRHNQFINIRASHSSVEFGSSPQNPPQILAEIDSNLFFNIVTDCTWAADKALGFGNYSLVRGNRFINLLPATVACVYPSHPYEAPPPEFRYNIFQAGDYAIYSPFRTADAIWNYWGDPTGPYNADFNPNGLGARVDDPVWFNPWCPDTNCSESAPERPFLPFPSSFLLSCYPNPFNSTLHLTLIPTGIGIVKLELYDVLGRQVDEIWHGPLAFRKDVTFDASAIASGIYFARVTDVISRKNLAMTKLVLLR